VLKLESEAANRRVNSSRMVLQAAWPRTIDFDDHGRVVGRVGGGPVVVRALKPRSAEMKCLFFSAMSRKCQGHGEPPDCHGSSAARPPAMHAGGRLRSHRSSTRNA
jgi:hypothetical protein